MSTSNNISSQADLAARLLHEGARRSGYDGLGVSDQVAGDGRPQAIVVRAPRGAAPMEIVLFNAGRAVMAVGSATTFEMSDDALTPDTASWEQFANLVAAIIDGRIVESVRVR